MATGDKILRCRLVLSMAMEWWITYTTVLFTVLKIKRNYNLFSPDSTLESDRYDSLAAAQRTAEVDIQQNSCKFSVQIQGWKQLQFSVSSPAAGFGSFTS
jgi:hypothetical protein